MAKAYHSIVGKESIVWGAIDWATPTPLDAVIGKQLAGLSLLAPKAFPLSLQSVGQLVLFHGS